MYRSFCRSVSAVWPFSMFVRTPARPTSRRVEPLTVGDLANHTFIDALVEHLEPTV